MSGEQGTLAYFAAASEAPASRQGFYGGAEKGRRHAASRSGPKMYVLGGEVNFQRQSIAAGPRVSRRVGRRGDVRFRRNDRRSK